MPAAAAALLTISQSTFGVMPSPQIVPDLLIALKRQPSLTPLASVQRSSPSFTRVELVPFDVPGFSLKVDDHPVVFSELNGGGRKRKEFTPPQPATNQQSKHGVTAFAPKMSPCEFSISERP